MTYNGWTNYETWCVHLWLSNDPYTYYTAQEATRDGHLRDFVETLMEESLSRATLESDLLNHALACVDWNEIEDALAEDDEDPTP